MSSERDPDYSRVVADADVLAADLLVGGAAREALDHVRRHSWLELVATDRLLEDAEAVVAELSTAELSTAELAADWRRTLESRTVTVDQPAGDHPALAAAYRGNAPHVVSLDERLHGPAAGANLRGLMDVSVRSPDAFARVFDPAATYELVFDEAYPGPDRDPRD
jgi:predicted nucleic acid-binding protein